MWQGSIIPKFGIIASVDVYLLFVLFEVRYPFFAESANKNEIRTKIGQFCANFFENFEINKYHLITFCDKIVGQLEHYFAQKKHVFVPFLP